ncbi:MAG: NUDIX domain-containing protein [Candidatus Heimdallarchaeota archaeon]
MKLTVDAVVFGYQEKDLKVLLIKRRYDPFKNKWALPGGFVQENESLEDAVHRELNEETGIDTTYLEQLYTYSEPHRDPRGRIISTAYYCLVNPKSFTVVENSNEATEVSWFSVDTLDNLGFDHLHIIEDAVNRLRGKIRYQPIGFELLPTVFPFKEVQAIYETILGVKFNRGNFRTKFLKLGVVKETNQIESGVSHRPAKMFTFDKDAYWKKSNEGYYFEI